MTWQPNEMIKWEEEQARDARESARKREAIEEANAAAEDPESSAELEAAWAKERERVEHERQEHERGS